MDKSEMTTEEIELNGRQYWMSKIVQNIRLSVPFNARFDKFKGAIDVKWNGSNYNVGALIQILMWEDHMAKTIPGNNLDVIRETRQRFMDNSACDEDTKMRCGYLLQQLKMDRILIIWFQNLTGGRMDAVPKYPQKVFDLFISFIAEMEDRATTNETSVPECVIRMKKIVLLTKETFDMEWEHHKRIIKIVAHPVMLTLPIVLRTSLPQNHPLYLSETDFNEAIGYFSDFANLTKDIGADERLYDNVKRHLTETKDKQMEFCTKEPVWKIPFYGALPETLATGFSTLEWRSNENEIEQATRQLDALNAEWNASLNLNFEDGDSVMENLCSGDSGGDTMELPGCSSSSNGQVNNETNPPIGYLTDQKVLRSMSDSSACSSDEDEEEPEDESKKEKEKSQPRIEDPITNCARSPNPRSPNHLRCLNSRSPNPRPQSPLFKINDNSSASPKNSTGHAIDKSNNTNAIEKEESDSESESESESSDNDDDDADNKVTSTGVDQATDKDGDCDGNESEASLSSASEVSSDSTASVSSDCDSDVKIGSGQKRKKKSKKSKKFRKRRGSGDCNNKKRKTDDDSDSESGEDDDNNNDEIERKNREKEIEKQNEINRKQREEAIERERKRREEEKIKIEEGRKRERAIEQEIEEKTRELEKIREREIEREKEIKRKQLELEKEREAKQKELEREKEREAKQKELEREKERVTKQKQLDMAAAAAKLRDLQRKELQIKQLEMAKKSNDIFEEKEKKKRDRETQKTLKKIQKQSHHSTETPSPQKKSPAPSSSPQRKSLALEKESAMIAEKATTASAPSPLKVTESKKRKVSFDEECRIVEVEHSPSKKPSLEQEVKSLKLSLINMEKKLANVFNTDEFREATEKIIKGDDGVANTKRQPATVVTPPTTSSSSSSSSSKMADDELMPPPSMSNLSILSSVLPKRKKSKDNGAKGVLKNMFGLNPKKIPFNGKQLPSPPDLTEDGPYSHVLDCLLIPADHPDLEFLNLDVLTSADFRYMLRWGAHWDPDANEKLKQSLNLKDEDISTTHYMNDYITKIYNKLSDAAARNKLVNLMELLAFRLLSQIKEMSSGSFSQINHNMIFRKHKQTTVNVKDDMTDKLCCVICEATRVQYGWNNESDNKIIMKFCSKCFHNNKSACLEYCQKDQVMLANKIKIKDIKDLDGHFKLISYGGKKMSIRMGVQVKKQNIPTVMPTPCRAPQFDDYPVIDLSVDQQNSATASANAEEPERKGPRMKKTPRKHTVDTPLFQREKKEKPQKVSKPKKKKEPISAVKEIDAKVAVDPQGYL